MERGGSVWSLALARECGYRWILLFKIPSLFCSLNEYLISNLSRWSQSRVLPLVGPNPCSRDIVPSPISKGTYIFFACYKPRPFLTISLGLRCVSAQGIFILFAHSIHSRDLTIYPWNHGDALPLMGRLNTRRPQAISTTISRSLPDGSDDQVTRRPPIRHTAPNLRKM
jgi:hypothetical protein